MNLGRVMGTTGVVVCLIVVMYGFAVFILGSVRETESHRYFLESSAQSVAKSLQRQTSAYAQIADNLSRTPRVAMLLEIGDELQLEAEAASLGDLIPGILTVRLLPSNLMKPDQSKTPHMGFADLEMVRMAAKEIPKPMVHAYRTPNGHIAIARRVMMDDRVVGVVLFSISTDSLSRALTSANVLGAVQVNQGSLNLASAGDSALTTDPETGTVPVAGTDWQIRYWVPTSIYSGWLALLVASLLTIMLVSLVFVYSSRWLKRLVLNDQAVIAKLAHALLSGKIQGNYPVKLKEFESLVSKITLLKRKGLAPLEAASQDRSAVPDEVDEDLGIASYLSVGTGIEVESKHQSSIPRSIFRAYDIRGIVDDSLTEDGVIAIGCAFGSEAQGCGQHNVIIAHDGRSTSPRLSAALTKGLQQSGCNVVDIGMVPTPVLYFATHFLDSSTGVMVTGSHNPPEYNGLKMVINGETWFNDRIQRLRERIEKGDFLSGTGTVESRDIVPDYVGTIIDDIQIGSPMKVVMDCGNGVAGKLGPVLMRTLGCEVVELYCDIDGSFPNHHPDPSKPENLKDLIDKVKQEQAHLGIAFDGDGDRLGVIDSSGKIIWPDRQMMMFAADVLSRQPGADIIFDVKCSRNLSKEIVQHGGRPLMWKTGHSLIKAKIKETGAMLAGEMSGHIFFSERWFGFDDGLYAAARMIEILSADPRPSSEVFEDFHDSLATPEINIALQEGENTAFVEKLLAKAPFPEAKITDIDGLRADFLHGWGLVRASNTTPSLVLRFEADSDEELSQIQKKFKDVMIQIKSDIELPF